MYDYKNELDDLRKSLREFFYKIQGKIKLVISYEENHILTSKVCNISSHSLRCETKPGCIPTVQLLIEFSNFNSGMHFSKIIPIEIAKGVIVDTDKLSLYYKVDSHEIFNAIIVNNEFDENKLDMDLLQDISSFVSSPSSQKYKKIPDDQLIDIVKNIKTGFFNSLQNIGNKTDFNSGDFSITLELFSNDFGHIDIKENLNNFRPFKTFVNTINVIGIELKDMKLTSVRVFPSTISRKPTLELTFYVVNLHGSIKRMNAFKNIE